MKINFLSTFIVLTLIGCCTETSISIKNASTNKIIVQSQHTSKSYEIKSGDERCIPHTSGQILVTLGEGEKPLEYDIDVTKFKMNKASLISGLPCLHHYTIRAQYNQKAALVIISEPQQ